MKLKFLLLFTSILCLQCVDPNTQKPPLAPEQTITNTYFSKKITDPYQYMENLSDTTVLNWLAKQNEYTNTVLQKISGRAKLLQKIEANDKLRSETIYDLKTIAPDAYYYLKTSPDHLANILCFKAGITGKEVEIFNSKNYKPNTNHNYIINYFQSSWNGKKIAISFTKNDEEISEIAILDLETQQLHNEIIDHCWPSELGGINWLPNDSGFIYTHIPVIDTKSPDYILNTSAVLYRLGSNPKNIKTLFSKESHPQLGLQAADFPMIHIFSQDQKYIFGRVGGIGFKDYYYAHIDDLDKENVHWIPFFKKKHKVEKFIPVGDDVYFLTAQHASNFRICKTNLQELNFDNPTTIVSEDSTQTLNDFTITNQGLFYTKTKNGVLSSLYQVKNKITKQISLPQAAGNIRLSSISPNYADLWIETESWVTHRNRYRYNHQISTFKEENLTPVIDYKELKDIVIEEIEITSHDGTKVPLSIIYKKGMKKDGKNRMLLNGYGSYNWINAPKLYPYLLYWLGEGGVYAVAHVRGGGEKGAVWHKAGYKDTKANTWKDFIACTEYLIAEKYTSPERFAVWGGSAGGINIGRAVTERPDLYAAVVIRVGLLNTLRSEIAPNGQNNVKEFGTVKKATEFKALLEMDAYQHVQKETAYPAMLLTAGLRDSRVAAWQPAKFAARVQAATTTDNPVLLAVNFTEGHGFDRTGKSKRNELADIISFALWQTDADGFEAR
ncbi:prolyl oligopeptidase family serine peptidase [uncultured Kordia sp.]|uniref:prolyl oligopeptidase family serine peptidase n=1 Tax=uncultured Kordia sp. TaxID=507699 RepID=UPI0026341D08|nr:prolyl oligopeptidase family serine peptidase [uncultured Kordia sp.]